jgi:hypothetical protein
MFSPLWEAVHGEARIDLPGMPELLPVLWEMGIFPNLEMLPPAERPGAPNIDVALQIARLFLYVQPGTEADQRLQEQAPQFVVETANGVTLRQAQTRPQAILWWRPGEFS